MWLDGAQQAQMPLLVHRDLPWNTVQTLASSDFERHTRIYSTLVGKASLKLLTATLLVETLHLTLTLALG